MVLLRLLARVDRSEISPVVISLRGEGYKGYISSALRRLEIPVHELNWTRLYQAPIAMKELMGAISNSKPDLIQGWMLYGSLAAHVANLAYRRRVPVLWNMRHSLHDLASERVAARASLHLLRLLSPASSRIVYNSRIVARQHEEIGFEASRSVIIPNGFDCCDTPSRQDCREAIRNALNIRPQTPLIGLVARVHRTKDHTNFLEAAERLSSTGCPAHFLLVGRGTDSHEMAVRIDALSLTGKVHALGERYDIPEIVAAMDLATSSSRAESFPNAVGEAMAGGIPCVVTDVGDSAWIVGDTGRVVPRADPVALSNAWLELLSLGGEALAKMGTAARNRITENFSIEASVAQYQELYREILHG